MSDPKKKALEEIKKDLTRPRCTNPDCKSYGKPHPNCNCG